MAAKTKILYIDDWGEWGGAEKVTLNLVKSLDRKRYEPCFILGSDGLFAQALRDEQIPVQIVPMTPMSIPDSQKHLMVIFLPKFFLRLAGYTLHSYFVARRIQPDIIQTCSIQAKLIGSFLSKFLPVKLLWHVHNIQPAGYRRKIVRLLVKLKFPDMIVAVSRAVANIYEDISPPEKLLVNYNGIDLAEFSDIDPGHARAALKTELGLSGDVRIIVNASMIKFWKGQHIFVNAAAEVIKHFPNTVFLIVGEAQFGKDKIYERQLLNQVDALNLTGRVKFLGFRKDVYSIVSAADCLVHCPVTSDPLPTIVLEAMAACTPIIGSDIGGIPEEIQHQESGWLVEPGDTQSLVEAITQMLENPDAGMRLAQTARKKLEEKFTLFSSARKFERIYDEILTEIVYTE